MNIETLKKAKELQDSIESLENKIKYFKNRDVQKLVVAFSDSTHNTYVDDRHNAIRPEFEFSKIIYQCLLEKMELKLHLLKKEFSNLK